MKHWKRWVSKRFRRQVKLAIAAGEDEILPESLKEVSDIWGSPSDGRPKYFVSYPRWGVTPDSLEETRREDEEFLAKITRK
jgi:hypothetical protein